MMKDTSGNSGEALSDDGAAHPQTTGFRFLIFALILGVAFAAMPRLEFNEDITALLPAGDPVVADYRLVLNEFQALNHLFIDIGSPTAKQRRLLQEVGQNSEENSAEATADYTSALVEAADAMHAELAASGLFDSLVYQMQPQDMMVLQQVMQRALPNLLTTNDLADIEARLSPEALEAKLHNLRRALMAPGSTFMRGAMMSDPLGLAELLKPKWQLMGANMAEAEMLDGRLWSADGRHLLIIATPNFPIMNTFGGAELRRVLEDAETAARDAISDPGAARQIKIVPHGGHLIAYDNAEAVKADLGRTFAAVALALGILAFVVFRRKVFVLLLFTPPMFGMIVGIGFLGWFHPQISGVALGCGAALVGITVDYGLHFLYRCEADDSISPWKAMRELRPALLATSTTTVAAFLTLLSSGMPTQRQLGLFSAIGATASVLFAIFILPALVSRIAKNKTNREQIENNNSLFNKTFSTPIQYKKVSLIIAALICLGAITGISRVRIEGDFRALNYLSEARHKAETYFNSVWGDFAPTRFVVRGTDKEKALQKNEQLLNLLQDQLKTGELEELTSIAALLPSSDTQLINQNRYNAFWTDARRETLTANLQTAATNTGFTPKAFEPFLANLPSSHSGENAIKPAENLLLSAADFNNTPVASALNMRIAEADTGETYILTTATPRDPMALKNIRQKIEREIPDIIVIDADEFADHTRALARSELLQLGWTAGLAIFIVLTIFLRRPRLIAAALLPIVASILVTLGLMGWIGIPINLLSGIFITYIFGVGIDYSVFLISSGGTSRRSMLHAMQAVAICGVTTSLGFLAMMLGQHPALYSIGAVGFIGIVSTLILSEILIPAMLKLFD